MNRSLLSSERTDWNTPQVIVDLLGKMGGVCFDPCSNPSSIVPCEDSCMLERGQDGLAVSWGHRGLVYCNPPYGREVSSWANKIAIEVTYFSTEIICLLPARTDTAWMQQLLVSCEPSVLFWRGRLRFIGAESSAPFPSVIMYWGRRHSLFRQVFGVHGYLFRGVQPCPRDI